MKIKSIQCTDFNGVYHTYGFPYAHFYVIIGWFQDSLLGLVLFLLLTIFFRFYFTPPLLSHFHPYSYSFCSVFSSLISFIHWLPLRFIYFLVVYFHPCVHFDYTWLYYEHLSAQRCNHYNFIFTQTCANV